MNYRIINRLPLLILAIAVGLGFFVSSWYYVLALIPIYAGLSLNYNLPGCRPFRRFSFRNIMIPHVKERADKDPKIFGEYIALTMSEDDYVKYGTKEFFRRKNELAEQELEKAKREVLISMGLKGEMPPPEIMDMIIAKLMEMRDRAKKKEDDKEDGEEGA